MLKKELDENAFWLVVSCCGNQSYHFRFVYLLKMWLDLDFYHSSIRVNVSTNHTFSHNLCPFFTVTMHAMQVLFIYHRVWDTSFALRIFSLGTIIRKYLFLQAMRCERRAHVYCMCSACLHLRLVCVYDTHWVSKNRTFNPKAPPHVLTAYSTCYASFIHMPHCLRHIVGTRIRKY